MKKSIGVYGIIWVICLAVFNVIVFVTPNKIGEVSKFSGSFWVGYIFITVAFAGQLVCAFFAFKTNNLKRFFYNISLISVSYGGLIAMLIVGSIFMAVPALPEWVGIITCTVILAVNVIAVIKAGSAAEAVNGIDENIKLRTTFIKSLMTEAQSLVTAARSDELRTETRKVYEAIRYSEPVANAELSKLDNQIERQFNAFADAVKADDNELAKETADVLVEMLERRNQKSKILK